MSVVSGEVLPEGWTLVRLSNIALINPPLGRVIGDDNISVHFVPMRAVEPEGKGLVRPEIRSFGEVKKGYTAFLSGDVIMAKITPCMENGKATVVPDFSGGVFFGSTEFHTIRAETGIENRWIAAFILQHEVRREAQRSMGGAVGQMRVPASFLDSLEVPLAPAPEQTRIADALDELLSELDAGVAALERVQAKLKRYRASVLKAAVGGTLTADWRARYPDAEPASELLERILAERRRRWEEEQLRKFEEKGKPPPKGWKSKYKEPAAPDTTDLPELPEGWCWATLDQLTWNSGYGTSVKCRDNGSGIPVLRIPNIVHGSIRLENLKYAPEEFKPSQPDCLDVGDLLVVRTNGSRSLIGRGVVISATPAYNLSFASYLIRLRLSLRSVTLRWISMLWSSSHVRYWIEKRAASSAGQHNISLRVLETLAVPLSPVSEQEQIAELVEAQLSVIDHLEADLDTKFKTAQALRQSILRHAFTGKLVPQDPEDESASELLKRIAAVRETRAREIAAAKKKVKAKIKTKAKAKAKAKTNGKSATSAKRGRKPGRTKGAKS